MTHSVSPSRNIFLGMIAYTGQVYVSTMYSLIEAAEECAKQQWGMMRFTVCNNGMIPLARNKVIAAFLKSPCTDLVCVDADVSWERGAFGQVVRHPVDFVGGVYRSRQDPESYSVRWPDDTTVLKADPETGLLEARGIPAGFLRLSRSAVERMAAASPWYEHEGEPHPLLFHFDFNQEKRTYMGEDYYLCDKWRELGGKVWIDPTLTLYHEGPKVFGGCLGDWLHKREAAKAAA